MPGVVAAASTPQVEGLAKSHDVQSGVAQSPLRGMPASTLQVALQAVPSSEVLSPGGVLHLLVTLLSCLVVHLLVWALSSSAL